MSSNLNVNPDDYRNSLVEIQLNEPKDFLMIRETLERVGISNNQTKTLIQTCHILHKKGRYYIVHFKELLRMDGASVTLTDEDIQRRDEVVKLLESWGLLKVLSKLKEYQTRTNLFVLQNRDRLNGWTFKARYQFGRLKSKQQKQIEEVDEDEELP